MYAPLSQPQWLVALPEFAAFACSHDFSCLYTSGKIMQKIIGRFK